MNRRGFLRSALGLGAAMSASGLATAQAYPARLIKLVVPSPPGGPHEVAVRILADRLTSSLGHPVIVRISPVELVAPWGPRWWQMRNQTVIRCWSPSRACWSLLQPFTRISVMTRPRLRSDRDGIQRSNDVGRQPGAACEVNQRPRRLCQGQPGKDQFSLCRIWDFPASSRGTVQAIGWHRYLPCAL